MDEIKVIYENDDVLVVDKPAGLLVHSDNSDAEGTLVEWFLRRQPEAAGVGEPRIGKDGKEIERSGIVHRLDKETSGVMILAKNQAAFEFLKEQFKERLAQKEYLALVYGAMKERWGSIDKSIGRSSKDFRKKSAERGAKGKLREALTNWQLIKIGTYEGEPFSFLELKPKTGRMHQLRVHLRAIGRPIVGDKLYATEKINSSNNLGLSRLALHSHSLTIVLPNVEEKKFESPLPDELRVAAEHIAS